MFIVFEGGSGGGKGTQIELLAKDLERYGLRVRKVSMLDSTEVGKAVREITRKVPHGELGHINEALLFLAAIGHATTELVLQAPKETVVIADRFVWSTMAYQGYGGGISLDWLEDLASVVIHDNWPDLTIYLDIPPAKGLARHVGTGQEHFEQLEFRSRVRKGYLTMAKKFNNWLVVDTRQSQEEVHRRILEKVLSLLN